MDKGFFFCLDKVMVGEGKGWCWEGRRLLSKQMPNPLCPTLCLPPKSGQVPLLPPHPWVIMYFPHLTEFHAGSGNPSRDEGRWVNEFGEMGG